MPNFIDDVDKMNDFYILSKQEFLASYGYLTEEEYDETERIVKKRAHTTLVEEKEA